MKKLLSAMLACVLFLTACSANPQLAEEKITVEYGENPYEVIKMENVIKDYDKLKDQYEFKMTLLDGDEKEIKKEDIKEDEPIAIGEYIMEIEYKKDADPLKVKVEIKDTTAPEFVDFKDEIKIEQNAQDVELKDYFKAKDLSKVTITVEGKADLSKTGEYEVTVIAADEYENKTEKNAKIFVVSSKEAEKGELTETADGKTPVSKKTQEKIEQGSVTIDNAVGNNGSAVKPSKPSNSGNSGSSNKPAGNSNSGSTSGGSSGNTGGSSSGNSGGSSGGNTNVCKPGTPSPAQIGNSGLLQTQKENDAFWDFWENDPDGFYETYGHDSWTGWTIMEDTCGNPMEEIIWTIQWTD